MQLLFAKKTFTFKHPHAPTVTYDCSLPEAISRYAFDHLYEFQVLAVEQADSPHGVSLEVIEKDESKHWGMVTIH